MRQVRAASRLTASHNNGSQSSWQAIPFCVLFGRDSRTQVDTATPTLDGENLRGLHIFIADHRKVLHQVQETRDVLEHRYEQSAPSCYLSDQALLCQAYRTSP